MCDKKSAPARFELRNFCLERILYSTEPQLWLTHVIYYAIYFPI